MIQKVNHGAWLVLSADTNGVHQSLNYSITNTDNGWEENTNNKKRKFQNCFG